MEAKYAPPDHDVFQLTPPPFDSRATKFYEEMGRPPVSSNSFWNVFQELLALFQDAELSEDLTEVLSDLENRTEQIAKEKVDVLPGLKPLRLGATVVGDGIVEDNNSEIEVEMTESDSGEEETNEAAGVSGPSTLTASMTRTQAGSESSLAIGRTHPGDPTFVASMTPSERSVGPTRNHRNSDRSSTHHSHTARSHRT
jgi:hypothetical protein